MACGTTTIIADPHEIVNVTGTAGMRYMLDASANTHLSIKFMLPSCVPACDIEELIVPFTPDDMEPFIDNDDVIGLGEMMDYPGLLGGGDIVLEKMAFAKKHGLIVDGHAPLLEANQLDGYVQREF